jgi:predicted metalloprotease with PDZ domain
MAKTAAERQKEYRASRQLAGENGERRIAAYVSTRAALALNRLANSYGVTKRELLEKLLIAEEDKVLRGLNLDSDEGKKYLGESHAHAD